MTEFNLGETIAVLSRTPARLDALLRGLPDVWVHSNEGRTKDGRSNEGNDTWSPFDIVGHLIVGERTDWMPRARIILEHGEARPFDPFDRLAQVREPPRNASRAGSSHAIGTSGYMGGSRPHSSASNIPRDGPPVS